MPRAGFKEKLARLKKLKQYLEQQPLTFQKACKLMGALNNPPYISKRMVSNYLEELCELDVAVYDIEAKAYKLKRLQKRVFKSKADYEIALNHSRKLLFSDEDAQRFDLMMPKAAIYLLAFPEGLRVDGKIITTGWNEPGLLQHLKNGYFEDFWLLLQKYRKMMEEYDYPNLLDPLGFLRLPPSPRRPGVYPSDYEERRKRLKDKIEREAEERRKFLSSPKIKQLKELETYLIGKLYTLMKMVEHGTPLAGYCDLCPNLKITIKDA